MPSDFSIDDLPKVYKHHIFACAQQRPPGHPRGSCAARGAHALIERLDQRLQQLQSPEIGFAWTGCMGFCQAGPLFVVYPEGVWYRPETPDDVDEIVQSHLMNGKPVERLVMVLTR